MGDATGMTFGDASFDSVATFTMLHHVPTAAAQDRILAEALRVLRPGGVLFGSDSLASNDLHEFHAGDTYNPVEPAALPDPAADPRVRQDHDRGGPRADVRGVQAGRRREVRVMNDAGARAHDGHRAGELRRRRGADAARRREPGRRAAGEPGAMGGRPAGGPQRRVQGPAGAAPGRDPGQPDPAGLRRDRSRVARRVPALPRAAGQRGRRRQPPDGAGAGRRAERPHRRGSPRPGPPSLAERPPALAADHRAGILASHRAPR